MKKARIENSTTGGTTDIGPDPGVDLVSDSANTGGGLSLLALFLPWLALLVTGVAYYVIFRSDVSFFPQILAPGLENLLYQTDQPLQLSTGWLQSLHMSFPSFIHAAAFAWLIVIGCRRLNVRWDMLLGLHVALCVVFELTTGTTSMLDLMAVVLGTFTATVLAINYRNTAPRSAADGATSLATYVAEDFYAVKHQRIRPRTVHSALAAITLSLSTVFTLATAPVPESSANRPVYLSYEELRRSVRVVSPRSSVNADRVYLYDNYLILNEKNFGLHVIDNSDPELPVNMGFIEIPGNTEVSIKRGFLYADSYIDLVTVDIRSLEFGDIDRIGEVNRVQDIFPYDEFQNVPEGVFLRDVDPERGIVIGYRSDS